MKNTLLSALFALISVAAFSTTVTITNSGTTFSPAEVTIQVGDTIKFQLESMHNAVEVSQATWTANGNTALPGFEVGFGGGTVTGLTAGIHYYVCVPHAFLQMKGKIIVNTTTGINNTTPDNVKLSVYPNPTRGIFTIQFQAKVLQTTSEPSLQIYNMKGEPIYTLPVVQEQTQIDFSLMPVGTYFIIINNNAKEYAEKVVLQ
jgi:plastocyanin